MKPYFDQIDALRFPSYEAQLADALLTLVLLIVLFSLIAGFAWLCVKVLEMSREPSLTSVCGGHTRKRSRNGDRRPSRRPSEVLPDLHIRVVEPL